MARHWFGDQTADVVVAPGEQVDVDALLGYYAVLAPGITLHTYDYTTGDRTTDLLDDAGLAITAVVTGQHGRIPRFRGPDSVERLIIGQDPATLPAEADPTAHRWTILTTSYPDIVDGLRTRIADLEADAGGGFVSSSHPLLWATPGEVVSHTSPHVVANLDGRDQAVTAVRASATMAAASQLTITVSTVDLATAALTTVETIVLTDLSPAVLVAAPVWTVPDGAGLTVGVAVDSGSAADLTVQTMVK